MDNILIHFVADPSGLQPGIDGLVQLEVVDKDLADQVKKTSAEMQKRDKAVSESVSKSSSQLEKLSNSFKGLDKSIVGGNYTKALKALQKEIDGTSDEFKQLQLAIGFAKKQLDGLKPGSADWKALNDQVKAGEQLLKTFGEEGEKVQNTTQSMRARLRELKTELQQLEDQGLDNTKNFQDLSIEAAKLEDQIGDTNARISSLASDTANIDAIIQGVQTLSAGFQIGAGAVALFGDESEDVQKALLKLNAIMAVTNGIREVQQALQAQSILRLKLEAIGQQVLGAATATTSGIFKLFGVSVETTATSFKVLRGAILATGIGAVIALLGFAADAMGFFGDSTSKAVSELEKFNIELEQTDRNLELSIADIDRRNKRIIEDLKRRNATEKELNAASIKSEEEKNLSYLEIANRRVAKIKETYGVLPNEIKKALGTVDRPIRDVVEATQFLNKVTAIEGTEAYNKLRGAAKDNFDTIKKAAEDAAAKFGLAAKAQTDAANDADEFATQLEEDRRKKAEEAAKKDKELTEKRLKAEFELLKSEKQKQIDFLNAQADSTGPNQATRENALRQALILEEETLIAERDLQLKQDNLTEAERELIKQRTADALINIEVEYGKRLRLITTNIAEENRQLQEDADNLLLNDALKAKKKIEDALKKTNRFNGIEEEAELKALVDQYSKGILSKEQYEARKNEIQNKWSRKNLEDEQKALEASIEQNNLPVAELEAAEQRLYEVKKQLRDKDLADQEAAHEKEIAAAQKAAERRQQILELAQQTAISLSQFAFNLAQKGYQKEEEKIKQLYDQKKISETEYNNQLKQLKRKQAQDEKAMAIFQILVNQGPAVIKGFQQGGFAGAAAAFTLFFSLLAAASSAEVPQFAKGKVRISGPGTDTSDSIVARISRNESVINATQTKKHEEALKAINEDRFQSYLMQHELPRYYQNMAMPAIPDVQTTSAHEPFNYERMAKAFAEEIANNPSTHVSIDENGLNLWTEEQRTITNYKNKKLNL